MTEQLKLLFEHKTIAILGFGREGHSTYTLFRKIFPEKQITIIDKNEDIRNDVNLAGDKFLDFITGEDCTKSINNFDVAIKSPGIPSNTLPDDLDRVHITSQTDIFLQCYGRQCIGITGTKGKSTTSSLVFHILKNAGHHCLLVGNIGTPPFDCLEEIRPETTIVLELSSHQLEYISHAPHIAVLLNLFQEHLDHYHSYQDYQLAKLNIAKYQLEEDFFIYNQDNETLNSLINNVNELKSESLAFSLKADTNAALRIKDSKVEFNYGGKSVQLYDASAGQPLQGNHNLYNIMAAAAACYLRNVGIEEIGDGIRTFIGLEHRIEFVGDYGGIRWYNDSIATIPEACIEAVKTLKAVDTLILGGFDRMIDYSILYPFLSNSGIKNIIFVGEAGKRMKAEFRNYGNGDLQFYEVLDYEEVVSVAARATEKGKICLLSPAAASYGMFKNFEERGMVFKKNVRSLSPSQDLVQ